MAANTISCCPAKIRDTLTLHTHKFFQRKKKRLANTPNVLRQPQWQEPHAQYYLIQMPYYSQQLFYSSSYRIQLTVTHKTANKEVDTEQTTKRSNLIENTYGHKKNNHQTSKQLDTPNKTINTSNETQINRQRNHRTLK